MDRQLGTRPPAGMADLAGALSAGTLLLTPEGRVAAADAQALTLLGCQDRGELSRRWEEIGKALEGETGSASLLLPAGADGRPLLFEMRRLEGEGTAAGSVVLVRDPEPLGAAAGDLQLAAFFRTLSQISPAVAHDLRAPINAMVFNIEILKETLAGARGLEPTARDRKLRYVGVLKEELARLHTGLEHLLANTSTRGDRTESFDLREAVQELVALLVPQARKLQVQVAPELPEEPVLVTANRLQVRQALLETGLAALSGVARAGKLSIRLASDPHRARLVLSGPPSSEAPTVEFELAAGPSPASSARLYHARARLDAQGGKLGVTAGVEGARSFEVELPVSGKE